MRGDKLSLNKAIEHGKEHREEYRGSKSIDKTCRNHGGCEWCEENRKYKYIKKQKAQEYRIKEYIDDG